MGYTNPITNFNRQNREYYSLRFSELQKQFAGTKVDLGNRCFIINPLVIDTAKASIANPNAINIIEIISI